MSVVNTATGGLVDFDTAAAERRAERITLRLDAIADNYRAVLPMIREAIEKRDDLALGYRSPGDYVSDRFGQSLAGLGIEVRRAVVGELTEAGLSTRAIAPVVGTNQATVVRDLQRGDAPASPDSEPVDAELIEDDFCTNCGGDEESCACETVAEYIVGVTVTPQGEAASTAGREADSTAPSEEASGTPRPAVTGIDGKTYARPERKAAPRKPLPDVARDLGQDLRRITDRFERFANDDRLARNKNEVAAHLRHHLAHALKVLTDLEQEINSPKESTS